MTDLGTIGIADEHVELHRVVRRWVDAHVSAKTTKASLDEPSGPVGLPPFWDDLVAQGWLGLHVEERFGGAGYGLPELVVVLEELGRACVPGPFLPTTVAAAAVQRCGPEELKATVLPAIVAGERIVGLALGPEPARVDGDRLVGRVDAVLGADGATDVLVALGDGRWAITPVVASDVTIVPSVDGTRRLGSVVIDATEGWSVLGEGPDDHPDEVLQLLLVLASAEAVGAMAWGAETAAAYACEREQFGRPIGQFQAVKHRCAGMLLALESARAVTWDAARAADEPTGDREVDLTALVVGALVTDAALQVAKDCIQVLGGIGYTWEHDAHLYLKRAVAQRSLLGGRDRWIGAVAGLVADGVRRSLRVDLGPAADDIRDEVRAFAAETKARPSSRVDRDDGRRRLPRAVLAGALGPGRVTHRADRDRRGAGGGPAPAPAPAGRCVGAPHDHRPRHRRAAGAVGAGDAARRDHVVPAVQRAGRGLGPRVAHDPSGAR